MSDYKGKSLRIDHCRRCNAEIVWVKTAKGKAMPVDAETASLDDTLYDHARHRSHFATCEAVNRFRKPK